MLIVMPGNIVSHFFHCNNIMLYDKDMLLVLPFCDRVMLNYISNDHVSSLWRVMLDCFQ